MCQRGFVLPRLPAQAMRSLPAGLTLLCLTTSLLASLTAGNSPQEERDGLAAQAETKKQQASAGKKPLTHRDVHRHAQQSEPQWVDAGPRGASQLDIRGAPGVHHDPMNLPLFNAAAEKAALAMAKLAKTRSANKPIRVLDLGSGSGVVRSQATRRCS